MKTIKLQGSEKQIAWAEDIRADWQRRLEAAKQALKNGDIYLVGEYQNVGQLRKFKYFYQDIADTDKSLGVQILQAYNHSDGKDREAKQQASIDVTKAAIKAVREKIETEDRASWWIEHR